GCRAAITPRRIAPGRACAHTSLPDAHGHRRCRADHDNGRMQGMDDEVDRIVDAWTRQRGDLDFTPLHVLSRVARLSRHLDRARRSAFARSELDSWEFDVLSALRRAGAPYELSPKALLRQTLVSSGTMTNRIDRLVARGL